MKVDLTTLIQFGHPEDVITYIKENPNDDDTVELLKILEIKGVDVEAFLKEC